MIDIGDTLPDLTLATGGGGLVSLSDLKGKIVVLYFYPKDDTPGCTTEACAFRDNLPDFSGLDCVVLGVSRDDGASHDKFKQKFSLNFPLLSDADGRLCEAFGVWKERSMYGKTFMGVERSTFLIDADGVVRKAWRKVNVDGHVDAVLAEVKALKG
ncbi:MAG: thioredoxin-dependent thiol peroxidase [Rhodospirillaceae bacterium]|nr:thioredoxin-dependent thiol peroxidase [Rhodospirillaceae bacterium]